MINLMPTSIKSDLSYARRNSSLRKWITVSMIALIISLLIIAGGLFYMQFMIGKYTDQVAVSKQNLQNQNVDETQKRVEEISKNTKLTTQVLSREILFSKLIRQIGSALPANTALEALQIDKIQGGIQLNAAASDFNAATQLQVNLQDPKNGVFEKADINSIDCDGADRADARFACSVSLRALFSKNNSYVYIAPAGVQ